VARGRNIKHDVESLTMVIRRIIRENGRDYVKTYIFRRFCLVLVAASTAFMAWIMEAVINEAFAKKNADLIWVICGSVLAAFVIRGAASYGQAVALAQVGNNLVARYQQRLIDHLMSLGVSYFGDTRSAQIAAQISQNVAGIRDVMNLTITSFARDLLTLVALIIVMITKDPVLSLIVLVVSPPVLLALRYISKRLRSATRESIDLNSRVLSAMQETVQGITIVKAFTMEEQISGRTAGLIKSAEERSNRIARLTERTSPLTETVAGIAISGVIAYAAFRSIYGDVLPGAFFSFITALLLAYDPARRLARLQINLERAVVNARMIYEILDEQPTQGDSANASELAVAGGGIEFRNVGFGYGQRRAGSRGCQFHRRGRQDHGHRRTVGRRQVDTDFAGAALLRPFIRSGADRRHRHCHRHQEVPAPPDRLCLAAALAVRGLDPRQSALRPSGCHRCRDRGGRKAGQRPRVHPGPAARL
jgi:subfamily B ATP-binding cassette protein MsbA